MSPTTAPLRATRRASDGRLVFARPPGQRPFALKISSNSEVACDWRGCGCSRWKLSRYCKRHHLNHAATGHPTAPSIRRSQWAPYISLSTAFINEQLRGSHPGIEAALRWLASELLQKGVARKADPLRPHTGYRSALNRCRRNGVDIVELLARVVSAELADDRSEVSRPLYASDEHRNHQGAKLFLYGLPQGRSTYAKRRRELDPVPTVETRGPGFKVRRFTHERIHGALGFLALNAANEIKRRLALVDAAMPIHPSPVSGSSIPFTSNHT